MVNNRPGPWKRPALHQRHHHSPPPQDHLSPRNGCPAKRKRGLSPDQVTNFISVGKNCPCLFILVKQRHLLVKSSHLSINTSPAMSSWIEAFASTCPCPITTQPPPLQPGWQDRFLLPHWIQNLNNTATGELTHHLRSATLSVVGFLDIIRIIQP